MKPEPHISLDAVLLEPFEFEFDLDFSLATLDREPLVEISPVRLTGTINRIEGGFALDGQVAFDARLECSRCLAAYPFALDETFSLLLYPRRPAGAEEREIEKRDLDVSYYDTENLPVSPIAEERIQLALPMKPLCREECAGLCPTCGEDRNAGSCDCRTETIDPRWNALRELQRIEKD